MNINEFIFKISLESLSTILPSWSNTVSHEFWKPNISYARIISPLGMFLLCCFLCYNLLLTDCWETHCAMWNVGDFFIEMKLLLLVKCSVSHLCGTCLSYFLVSLLCAIWHYCMDTHVIYVSYVGTLFNLKQN